MKKTILISLSILIYTAVFSQNPAPTNWENFSPDCTTDFWTITVDGHIQQWSLINGTITGGDTLLSGGGNSLAYCGDKNDPKFFSNSYSTVGLTYYEPDSGWINIPTSFTIDNNGGHLNDHFYRIEGAVIQIMAYWDGTNLLTIDSLQGEFFAGTADIAVNTSGQAWVSTGSMPGNVDSLKVYNQSGKINSYAFQQNMQGYGSFFLNDTLYLGTLQDSIYPVIINGTSAQLGNPIAFPTRNFTDMASCQRKESSTSIQPLPATKIKLFPNPTRSHLTLPSGIERSQITVYSTQGQIISPKLNGRILDLSEYPSGVYLIKLSTGGATSFHKVKKL